MKRLFPLCLSIVCCLCSGSLIHAQGRGFRPERLYFGVGAGKAFTPGGATCLGLAGTLIGSNHWGGSITGQIAFYEPEAMPPDYHGGGFFGFDPEDLVQTVSLHLVREWETRALQIRLVAEGGVGYVRYQYSRFVPNPNPGWFGSNYQEITDARQTIGLSLRGSVLFPVARTFGIELAAAGNVNELKSVVQAELRLNFGLLRGGFGRKNYSPRRPARNHF